MLVTVAEMLQFEGLNGCQVLAGAGGLEREVTRVNVVDVPDIDKWTKGGEFLITTAYFAKDNPLEIGELVRQVHAAGAACLGVKLHRFVHSLPKEVLEVADELDFPLIAIPADKAFVDIINLVLSNIVNQQARRLQLSEQIHRSFTQLVIDGGNTQEIVNTLANIIGEEVGYIDIYFDQFYLSANATKGYERDGLLLQIDQFIHETVAIDSTTFGYVVLPLQAHDCSLTEHMRLALEHSITILKLDAQKRVSNHQIEARYRDLFLHDLIFNNIRSLEEVQKRASLFGWDLTGSLTALIVDIDDFKARLLEAADSGLRSQPLEDARRQIFRLARRQMEQLGSSVYFTNFSDSIVFMVQHKPKTQGKAREFMRQLREITGQVRHVIAQETDFTVTIGMGSYKDSVLKLHQSYNEAKEAVRLGRVIYKSDNVVPYDELGVYRLLAPIYESKVAEDFFEQYLGRLLKYDESHHTDLVETLRCLIDSDWNLRLTADRLFVHYNTVKYRYARICEILDLDLEAPEEKLRLVLALKLKQMSG